MKLQLLQFAFLLPLCYLSSVKIPLLKISLLLFASAAFAQQVPFRNYMAKEGLIRNSVRTIFQDAKGFIWFGTVDGVDRYDGASFTHYRTTSGLANDWVNQIYEDRNGNLWMATNYAGISKYVEGTFINYPVAPENPEGGENRVNTIYQDHNGTYWIGTDGGLFQPVNGLSRFDGERFTAVQSGNNLIRQNIYDIFEDSRHTMWFGTRGGLCRLATASHPVITTIPLIRGAEFEDVTFAEDGQGNIWYGTDKGLGIIRNPDDARANHTTLPLPPVLQFLSDQWIRVLLFDPHHHLWIGTRDHGLWKYTPDGRLSIYNMANGLAGNNVGDIYCDREGNLWFATNTGVSKLAHEQVVNYTVLDGLAEHAISASALVQDGAGHFWFGTRRGLSKLVNGKILTYTTAEGLPENYVLCLLKDKTGTVWVGTPNGVSKIVASGSKDTFVTYRKQMATNIIYQDDEGNLWFGTPFGVSLLANGKFTDFDLRGEYNSSPARTIVRDSHGDLWVGFLNDGIVRFAVQVDNHEKLSLTEVARYRQIDGLTDDHIRSSFKDRNDNLWFGTRHGGVSRFIMEETHVKAIRNYTTAEGLSGNWVNVIMQDRHGNLWFGTDRGADCMIVSGHGIVTFRHFTMEEGLAGENVLACYEDERGYLWFGTSNGVTWYDPAAQPNLIPPPVHITQFQIFGKADSSALRRKQVDLAYNQHSVAFEYVGLSFKDETKVRYQHKLEGLDAEWSGETDRRYVNYTHLPSGEYVFKVKARNADGVWSTTPATFAFRLATPYWRTWWFISLVVIGIIGIVIGVHRTRVRRLVEMERMRSRIATDLHDDLGSTLSSISIFSEMAKQETEAVSPRAAQMLRRIGESSRAMLETMDDIVWAINPENDSLDNVTLRIRELATELLEAAGIQFTIHVPENALRLKLPMDVRRNFYLIAKEAINNLVRHSQSRHADISITTHNHLLELIISDDGIGFNGAPTASGNGIKNMQKRAGTIGGELAITSQEGKGTTITLAMRIT